MKKSYLILLLVVLLFGLNSIGQNKEMRLNFILAIDNEIPIAKIFDGYFLIQNKIHYKQDTLRFQYQVGGLLLSSTDYQNLFLVDSLSTITIKFKYRNFTQNFTHVYNYEKVLRNTWINESYIILNVFNYYDADSRKKYFISKNQYLIQVQVPGGGNVIARRK